MPPKGGGATGAARRGRSTARGRRRGKEHGRILSDITEESVSQDQTKAISEKQAAQGNGPKKRAFQDIATNQDSPGAPAKRETRAQAAKRMKIQSSASGKVQIMDQNQTESGEKPQSDSHGAQLADDAGILPDADIESASGYIPSLNLLFFVQLANLDIDADTECITLSLIDLTLAEPNWHTGLSGLVQPVACFLIASLLTRRQNLIEDIAASVGMFGLEYEQLVEGYKLLWDWRENMSGVVGVYAERLAELPDPTLLLGQGEQEGTVQYDFQDFKGIDERPEPERETGTLEL